MSRFPSRFPLGAWSAGCPDRPACGGSRFHYNPISIVLANVQHSVVVEDQVLSLDAGESTFDLRLLVEADALDFLRIALNRILDRAYGVIGVDVMS